MTVNDINSSATVVNRRRPHNNSDDAATGGSGTAADNAGNSAGDAMADSADESGDLLGGNGLAAMDPAPLVASGIPQPQAGPVLSGAGNSVDYAPGGPPVPINLQIAVTDTAMLTGATVKIASGFFIGDNLNFTNQNGITGSYNTFTGVLTLTGAASAATYQAALQSITFTSSNGNPTNSGADDYRTVDWTVTDGTPSNTITSAIVVEILDGVQGAFVVYDIRNNSVLSVQNLYQIGLAWNVAGFEDFSGNTNETDMLLRNSTTGAFQLFDISKNTVMSASALAITYPSGVFSDWTVAGFGDFSGNITNNIAASDMLLRNSSTGAFEVYDNINGTINLTGSSAGVVGSPWTVAGFGGFSGNANETDMMMRNSNTGVFAVYDIVNNAITSSTALGAVGLEWTVAGFGNFSSIANETDMLLRNSNTGAFQLYDISHNTITFSTALGVVGLDWAVAGFGNFSGNNESDMLMRNSITGAFEVYDISHNAISTAVPMGAIGLEWGVSGFGDFATDPESDMVMRDTLVETATLIAPPGPLGSVAAAAAPFVVFGDFTPQFTGSLVLTDGTFSTALAYTGNGTYTANLDTWADGLVSATLAVVDWYGNSFATSTTVPIDPDLGRAVTLTAASTLVGSAGASAVKFVVAGTLDADDTLGSLTLTDGVVSSAESFTGTGTYTFNLSASSWTDGAVTSTLTVSDVAGNTFAAAGAPVTLDKDTGATPLLTVVGVTETIGRATATFTITGLDAADSGPGNTATVSFVEAGLGTLTTVVSGVVIGQTYTEVLSSVTSAPFFSSMTETLATSLAFTDVAGNTFAASGNNVTLVAPNPGLQVSPNIGAVLSGTVSDLYTQSITLVVGDANNGSTSLTVSETAANGLIIWSSTVTYAGTSWSVSAFVAGIGGTAVAMGSGSAYDAEGPPINLALTDPGGGDPVAVPVGGSGGAEINGGATLEFGAASSANVGFAAGAAGMLKLDQSSGFSGTVAGFGAGDAIDLADIMFGGSDTLAYAANAGGTGGVLSVSDGTHAANLALIGQYAAAEFATAPDPGGGTVVTYAQAPPAGGINNQALLAHPHH